MRSLRAAVAAMLLTTPFGLVVAVPDPATATSSPAATTASPAPTDQPADQPADGPDEAGTPGPATALPLGREHPPHAAAEIDYVFSSARTERGTLGLDLHRPVPAPIPPAADGTAPGSRTTSCSRHARA